MVFTIQMLYNVLQRSRVCYAKNLLMGNMAFYLVAQFRVVCIMYISISHINNFVIGVVMFTRKPYREGSPNTCNSGPLGTFASNLISPFHSDHWMCESNRYSHWTSGNFQIGI